MEYRIKIREHKSCPKFKDRKEEKVKKDKRKKTDKRSWLERDEK